MNNLELRKFVAPEFVFGSGARFLVGQYAKNFGARKVLIVTGPHVTAAGWVDPVIEALKDEGIDYRIFSDVTPNPRAEEVMEGASLYKNENCNFIVAVGGGSPMDCAKGIGIVSSNEKDICKFEGVDRVAIPAPPLICIPTTAGSAADVSQFAIISDQNRKIKMAIVSKTLVPDVALIDPETTTTMDRFLTVSTGFDALSHAIEAYLSNASSPITDLHALEAIRLASANLLPTIQDMDNLNLRSNMMLSSLNAGLAFSNASLGLVHALAHSLGGLLDKAHGECNAILLDHVMEFNFKAAPEKFKPIGEALGLENIGKMDSEELKIRVTGAVKDLKKKLGMNLTLKELGVKKQDIPQLARTAMKDPCIITNPRRPTQEEVEEVLNGAI